MENIYKPENFAASDVLDLKEYFEKYRGECYLPISEPNSVNEQLSILKEEFQLSLNTDDIQVLEDMCTVDKLRLGEETSELPMDHPRHDQNIPHIHLLTEQSMCLETAKFKKVFNVSKRIYESNVHFKKRYACDNKADNDGLKPDIQAGSDMVCEVHVHKPFNTMAGRKMTSDSIRVLSKIELLGTNNLVDLANNINCLSDTFIIHEVQSTELDLTKHLNAREKYPSRCFFIENTFYNDMSHPNSIDYSTVVCKWALEHNIGEFKSQTMENVTLDSLKLRFGYGYVYIHQGNCEHLISFSDARLIQKTDSLVTKKYPRILSRLRSLNHVCFMCTQNIASWFVVDSDRLPVRKAFFCTACLKSYHFVDGQKVGDFKLFPYRNNMFPEDARQPNPSSDSSDDEL